MPELRTLSSRFTQQIAFNPAIKFNRLVTTYALKTVDAPITFSIDTVDAVPGAGSIVKLQADGINSPEFSGFKESSTSLSFDNRVVNSIGVLNVIHFFFDGDSYWYSVFQELSPLPVSVDTTAPGLESLRVSSTNASTVVLVYSEVLDENFVPAPTDFSITGVAVNSVSILNESVSVLAGAAIPAGASISYTPGTSPLKDLAGNNAPAINPAQLIPAPPAELGEVLSFTTRTANISVSGDDYVTSEPDFFSTYMLADEKLSGDGWVSLDYLTAENDNIIIGLSSSDTNRPYNGTPPPYTYFAWVAGGDFFRGTNGVDVQNTNISVSTGGKYRLRRAGAVTSLEKLESSAWENVYTWPEASNGDLFINVCMNGPRASNPRILGGAAK